MSHLVKILKYSLYDLVRNRWIFIYCGFYLLVTTLLCLMSNEPSKVIISLLNIVLVISPLMAILITSMYYYNSRDFLEFLLAQPMPRISVIYGLFGGLSLALIISIVAGLGLPALIFGIWNSSVSTTFMDLLMMGAVLSVIFAALTLSISIRNENRIKGFGMAILLWLFLALIYDGLILLILLFFKEYPLEQFSIVAMMCNPIDLARTMILLKLDISALMGYTGAVIEKFYGKLTGMLLILGSLTVWILLPGYLLGRTARKKDW